MKCIYISGKMADGFYSGLLIKLIKDEQESCRAVFTRKSGRQFEMTKEVEL